MNRLGSAASILLVVDVQDKLLAKMPDASGLVRDVTFLIDIAQLLSVPVFATEQYPKGLGPTDAQIAGRLTCVRLPKVAFSACGATGLSESLRDTKRPTIVLAGMETHVCILNTTLDLLTEGYEVYLAIDAVQSRYRIDHDIALRRLEKAGAILTTVETTAFEWLGSADHPHFKAVSKLVQERMQAMK